MLRGGRLLPGSSVLDVYVAVLPSCDCHVLDDFACVWSLTLRSSSTTTPRSDPRTIRLVPTPEPIVAVVFDMDGVLVDTEHLGDEVREELTEGVGRPLYARGAAGDDGHEVDQWSRYLHEAVGLQEPPDVINAEVVRRMLRALRDRAAHRPPAPSMLSVRLAAKASDSRSRRPRTVS